MSDATSMSAATSSGTAETLFQAGAPSSATCTDSPSHEATGSDAAAAAPGFDAVGIPEIATSPDDTSAPTPGGATSDAPGAEKSLDPLKQPLSEEIPDEDERLQPALEMVSILAHLAVFAILGVCIRFGLEILFGPLVAHVTDDSQSIFLDVPANMAGSFLMGIVGYTSKKDIAAYSQPLAIGLSTGLCGSITTYGSWNQRMMAIMAYGLVLRALFGYILGTALTWHSFSVGVDAGEGLRELLRRRNLRQLDRGRRPWAPRPEHFQRRWRALVLAVGAALALWLAAALVFALGTAPKLRKLALGSLVGPFGCWLRWSLSFQNGKGVGVGERRWLKWVPVGTLAANLMAVTLEAVTSAVDSIHNTETGSLIVGGVQLGFMGCLSTVSTLICEAHILTNAKAAQWRGYAYLYLATFLPSILIGICLYCIPVWVFGVASNGYNPV